MKRCILMVGLLAASSTSMADVQSDAFMTALDKAAANCELMAFTDRLQLKSYEMDESSGVNGANTRGFVALLKANGTNELVCVEAAQDNAKELFTTYMAAENNQKLKDDAKNVYATWIAALSSRVHDGSSSQRPEVAEYHKAKSVMEVDSASE